MNNSAEQATKFQNTKTAAIAINMFLAFTTIIFLVLLYLYKMHSLKRIRGSWRLRFQINLVIITGALLLLRLLLTQLLINATEIVAPGSGAQVCSALSKISSVLLDVVSFCGFVCMWYRQWLLYQQPTLLCLRTPVVSALSGACLALHATKTLVYSIVFVAAARPGYDALSGCVDGSRAPAWTFLVLNGLGVASLIGVVLLYVKPLWHQLRARSRLVNLRHTRTASRITLIAWTSTVGLVTGVASAMVGAALNGLLFVDSSRYPSYCRYVVNNVTVLIFAVQISFGFGRFRTFALARLLRCAAPAPVPHAQLVATIKTPDSGLALCRGCLLPAP